MAPPSTPPPKSIVGESAVDGKVATPTPRKSAKLPSMTPLTPLTLLAPLTPSSAVVSAGRPLEMAVLGKASSDHDGVGPDAPTSSTPATLSNHKAAFGVAAGGKASGEESGGGKADPDDDSVSSI